MFLDDELELIHNDSSVEGKDKSVALIRACLKRLPAVTEVSPTDGGITMTTIKSHTDLDQSKKLAECLPLGSADFHFSANLSPKGYLEKPIWGNPEYANYNAFPCWSLSALLDILPFPQLSKDKLGSGKIGWMVSAYPNDCRYDSCWHDNPIDACYEMILFLHEQNLI